MKSPLLHYEHFGHITLSPIVLLHGFLGDMRDWAPVFDRLGDQFGFLAIDLPGHGKSRELGLDFNFGQTSDAVFDVLNANNISKCHMLGYSMGGRIALYTAISNPDRFLTLILESCTAGVDDRANRLEFENRWSRRLRESSMKEFLPEWYSMVLFKTIREQPLFAELLNRRAQNDPMALSRVMVNLGSAKMPSMWSDMSELDIPIHYIYGEMDIKYKKLVSRMKKHAKNMTPHKIKNSGHNSHFENPDEFCNVIKTICAQKE